MLLDRIRESEVTEIVSAGFESQLVVRDVARYDEAASAVALGQEKRCLIVLGAPHIEDNLVSRFATASRGLTIPLRLWMIFGRVFRRFPSANQHRADLLGIGHTESVEP